MRKIEIFTMGKTAEEKVGCTGCLLSCETRDEEVLKAEVLYNQLLAYYGNEAEVVLHDYEAGDQDAILARQNDIYKNEGVKRMVNKVLIGPLSDRIWPSVVIDGRIKSEAALLDLSRIIALLKVQ